MSSLYTKSPEKMGGPKKKEDVFEISPWEIEESMDMDMVNVAKEDQPKNFELKEQVTADKVRRIKSSLTRFSSSVNKTKKPEEPGSNFGLARTSQIINEAESRQSNIFSRWSSNSEQFRQIPKSSTPSLDPRRVQFYSAKTLHRNWELGDNIEFKPLYGKTLLRDRNAQESLLTEDKINYYLSFQERFHKNEAKIMNLTLGNINKKTNSASSKSISKSTTEGVSPDPNIIHSCCNLNSNLRDEKKITTFAYRYRKGVKLRKAERNDKAKQAFDELISKLKLSTITKRPPFAYILSSLNHSNKATYFIKEKPMSAHVSSSSSTTLDKKFLQKTNLIGGLLSKPLNELKLKVQGIPQNI